LDINANREFGTIIHTLLRERYLEAGIEPPNLIVGTLGETLERIARITYKERAQSNMTLRQFVEASTFNPMVQFCLRILHTMVWVAFLSPEDADRAVGPLTRTQQWFKSLGYRPLTDEEMAELTPRLVGLVQQTQLPGTLGAAGDALLSTVNRRLKGYPPGAKGGPRRQRFLQDAYNLCRQVETAPTLADCKAQVAQLSDKLQSELKNSGCRDLTGQMNIYQAECSLLLPDPKIIG
jgi:hypothetical protein